MTDEVRKTTESSRSRSMRGLTDPVTTDRSTSDPLSQNGPQKSKDREQHLRSPSKPHSPIDDVQGPSWVNVYNPSALIGQIYFPTNVSTLDAQDYQELQKIIQAYYSQVMNGRTVFRMFGFADYRDTKKYSDNYDLSKKRAESVDRFLAAGFTGGSGKHTNFIADIRGFGEVHGSKRFGRTSEQLAGFRRVDIIADPLKRYEPPKRNVPEPYRGSTRWKARITRSISVESGAGAAWFEMTIMDLHNWFRMDYKFFGIGAGVSPKWSLVSGGSNSWKIFDTKFAIRVWDFEGFARYISGGIAFGWGYTKDIIHMVGNGATDPVWLEWKLSGGEAVGVGVAFFDGTLKPISKPYILPKDAD